MKYRALMFLVFVALSGVVCGASKPALTLSQKLALARHLADEAAQGKAETGRVLTGDFDFAKELERCKSLGKIPNSPQESIAEDSDITAESPTVATSKKDDAKTDSSTKKKYVVDTSKDFINGYYTGIVGGDKDASQARKKEIEELAKLEKKLSQLPDYFSYKGRLFDLLSDNYRAHTTLIYALGEFEKVFDTYFSNDNQQLVLLKKISIKISDEKNPQRNTNLFVSQSGDFTLHIAWTKSLKIEEFCDAIANAVLLKIAYESGGKGAMEKVPIWLKMGIARSLEQSIRFGVSAEMAEISAKVPPELPEKIFALTQTTLSAQSHSFWTLVAIEKVIKDKSILSAFIRRVLAGESPKSLSEKMLAFKPLRYYDFQIWWRCLITGEIWARMGGLLSAERSVSEVSRLAILQVNTSDGQRVGVSVSKLFEHRDVLQNEIKQRVLEIKVALSTINPIFYNSLVSLGRMYEAIYEDNLSDFNEAKKQFISDYKYAQLVLQQVKTLNK